MVPLQDLTTSPLVQGLLGLENFKITIMTPALHLHLTMSTQTPLLAREVTHGTSDRRVLPGLTLETMVGKDLLQGGTLVLEVLEVPVRCGGIIAWRGREGHTSAPGLRVSNARLQASTSCWDAVQ